MGDRGPGISLLRFSSKDVEVIDRLCSAHESTRWLQLSLAVLRGCKLVATEGDFPGCRRC